MASEALFLLTSESDREYAQALNSESNRGAEGLVSSLPVRSRESVKHLTARAVEKKRFLKESGMNH